MHKVAMITKSVMLTLTPDPSASSDQSAGRPDPPDPELEADGRNGNWGNGLARWTGGLLQNARHRFESWKRIQVFFII
jgi:hypothetical protein